MSMGVGGQYPGYNTTPSTNTIPQSYGFAKPTTSYTSSSSSMGKNVTSTPTTTIQSKLGISADGIYGPQTTQAVKDFQAKNGLTVDGIVGPQTLAKLMGTSSSSSGTGGYTPQMSSSSGQPYNQYNSGIFGQMIADLANRSTQSGQDYKDAQAEAQRIQDQQTALSQDYAKNRNQIYGTAGFLTQATGLQGLLQDKYNIGQNALSQQYAGATSRLSAANTQQGLLQQALTQAMQYAQPQLGAYGQGYYNPLQPGANAAGGQYGTGPGAASNVQSIQQAQTGINDIKTNAPAIDNNFSSAINYAQSAGLTGDSPIISGFQNKYGSNFQTNPAVIGFNQYITSLNQLLQSLGEAPIDVNTATMTTLQQAQQTVSADLARKQSSYQSFVDSYNNGGGSSSSYSSGGIYGW